MLIHFTDESGSGLLIFDIVFLQEEEFDDRKVQIRPPGFHVIFLPYADDFRKVKFEQTTKGRF